MIVRNVSIIGLLFAAACGGDLKPNDNPDSGMMPSNERFTHTTSADGTTTTLVNATPESEWFYFDLEGKKQVTPATPNMSHEWDLAFNRWRVASNGGISGSGGVEVAILPGADFATLTKAPAFGYVVDQNDGADTDPDPDFAFSQRHENSETGWYVYNEANHTLAPANVAYVVKTVEGAYFKVKMTAYYSEAGTAGYPKFDWKRIDPPDNIPGVLTIDAGAEWVYVDVTNGPVNVSTPDMSADWDLGFRAAAIMTNSGTTRVGLGGARAAPQGLTWDQVTSAPTTGYVLDKRIPFPAAPGAGMFVGSPVLSDWFNYDSVNHIATSKGLIYLVRTAGGDYAKLQVVDFDSVESIYQIKLEAVPREVNVETLAVDASDRDVWTYVDLELGQVIDVIDPSANTAWDLGLSGTRIRTNGGTSGPGMAGAAEAAMPALAAITTAAGATFEIDRQVGPTSANPVLSDWYQFSAGTGTTAKDAAYLVRTGSEGFVKLKVRDWDDGQFTIDFAYAGAGHEDF